MTKDIDALVAAADAPDDAAEDLLIFWGMGWDDGLNDKFAIARDRLTEYRAAREAVRKGTPPAYATSA